MPEEYRNIYKTARHAAGLTQEAAAERLGVSPKSIYAYETGKVIPPDRVVELMVICYDAQHLAYQHIKESNSLMERVLPTLEERTMLETCVRIFNRMRDFSEHHCIERLLSIAEDNIIDDEERPDFYAIRADLREIVKSGLELEVCCTGDGDRE